MAKETKNSTLRIKSIEVNNFKSLVNFKMDLAKFTCLIGLNGAGKSTVLQFIDFLAQLMKGSVDSWLKQRQWKKSDLSSKLFGNARVINFNVRFAHTDGTPAGRWEADYDIIDGRCMEERIDMLDCVLRSTEKDASHYWIGKASNDSSDFSHTNWRLREFIFQGSILSALTDKLLPESLRACRHFFRQIESLDTLTPDLLREETEESLGKLGHGGRNLAAFIHELSRTERGELAKKVAQAYPQVSTVYTSVLKSKQKRIQAIEQFGKIGITTRAQHLNDGMLRFLAILAELLSRHELLLFEEIENGINTEVVELLCDTLVKAEQQIVVTTHSPLILNYLDDDVAKAGVMYVYKNAKGHTQAFPFFEIPSMKEKLTVMGPGEVFSDTHLFRLFDEIAKLEKSRSKIVTKEEK